MTWTQASITRAVKAAIRGAHEMNLGVTGFTVTFSQGAPSVAVTCGADSAQPSPVNTGGKDAIEALKERQRRSHARRS
jgi:hypothetical protein